MQLWSSWLEAIDFTLQLLASTFGLGTGVAIILLTLALRFALLPASWSSAYRACVHGKRKAKLRPELVRLRQQFGGRPEIVAAKTLELHRRRNVPLIETRSFLGALIQLPVFLGMFQLLRSGVEAARFLWISSLAKPDICLAILAGVTTALMMAANPELPEQARMFMIVLPSIITFLFALKLASALAVYWITSNLFTAVHTAAVHFVVARRIRNGSLAI